MMGRDVLGVFRRGIFLGRRLAGFEGFMADGKAWDGWMDGWATNVMISDRMD